MPLDYFPAFLKLEGRAVLVVGGGPVAVRKANSLLAAGAAVTVVASKACAEIVALAEAGRLTLKQRSFRRQDAGRCWLVVNATGDPHTGAVVAGAAEAARVFCNSVDDIDGCSYIVPAVVDRSPLVVAISSGGAAPVLARRVRAALEALLSTNIGRIAACAGSWRARVGEAIVGFRERRYFWERLFDGRLEDALAAGGSRAMDRLIADELARAAGDTPAAGKAWLVGAGPGDPGLLTLKALQVMQAADVILHDRLVSPAILALARRDAELIAVGKKPGSSANSQESINRLMVERVAAGDRVCRLKGGDPFVFGRGGEEVDALAAAGLPCTIVPGITAALGCAAAAGIPLTHREATQAVTLVTGHGSDPDDDRDWGMLAGGRQTLVVYMGVSRAGELMQNLTTNGRAADTPVAIVERGTLPGQRIVRGTLGQLELLVSAHRITSPALLIIGAVARRGVAMTPGVPSMTGESAITGAACAITGASL